MTALLDWIASVVGGELARRKRIERRAKAARERLARAMKAVDTAREEWSAYEREAARAREISDRLEF